MKLIIDKERKTIEIIGSVSIIEFNKLVEENGFQDYIIKGFNEDL